MVRPRTEHALWCRRSISMRRQAADTSPGPSSWIWCAQTRHAAYAAFCSNVLQSALASTQQPPAPAQIQIRRQEASIFMAWQCSESFVVSCTHMPLAQHDTTCVA